MPSHQAGPLLASLPSQSLSCLADLTEPSWAVVGISDPAPAKPFTPWEGSPGAQWHTPKGLKIPILKLCSDKVSDILLQTTTPKLPNNLIFQAEDLPCMGNSFSLLVPMNAVNHFVLGNYNSRIHTPHFVYLRFRPPVSPGSTVPQEPTALIHPGNHPKIKWVSPGGPWTSPRTS